MKPEPSTNEPSFLSDGSAVWVGQGAETHGPQFELVARRADGSLQAVSSGSVQERPAQLVGGAFCGNPVSASSVPGLRWLADRRTWRLTYVNEKGDRKRRDLGPDQELAERAARDELDLVRRIVAGGVSPAVRARAKPLAEHIVDFSRWLDNGERTPEYVAFRLGVLKDWSAAMGARRLEDLSSPSVTEWLRNLKESAPTAKYGNDGLSAGSLNHRIRALKQFARWLVEERRLEANPLGSVKKFNEDVDRRRVRRSMPVEHFKRLVSVALDRPLVEAVGSVNSGPRIPEILAP